MIYARLDVGMWCHEKFIAAGAEATGLWAATLSYLRFHESSDGRISRQALGMILGIGEKRAVALAERLVKNQLFASHPEGYELLRYAEKNETKKEIAERRAATAARVAKHRQRVTSNVSPAVVTALATEEETGTVSALVPDSDSVSGSVISLGRVQRGDLRQPEPGERYVARDDPLTPEMTAIAEQNSVQRVEGCWKTFCGKRAGKLLNVAGDFQAWCVRWASYERKERDEAYEKKKHEGTPNYRDWKKETA